MTTRHLLTVVVLAMCASCFAQDPDTIFFQRSGDKYLSLLVGYNFWDNHFFEVGLAHNQLDKLGHQAFGFNYFVSTEVRVASETVVGPKIGVWFANGLGMGLNLIYYTDFDDASLRFRPEIGIGMSRFKMVYGYNLALTNKDFDKINKHNIGLNLLLTLKKIRDRGNSSRPM